MTDADELGRQAEQSDWLDSAVRFGLVVCGIVYLLIAWLSASSRWVSIRGR